MFNQNADSRGGRVDYQYFEIDVSVDDPSDHPQVEPSVDIEPFLQKLRLKKMLAPVSWSAQSKSFTHRRLRAEDEAMIARAIAASQSALREQIYPQLANGLDYELVSEILVAVDFGCVTSKWLVVLAIVGLVADGATISSIPDRFTKEAAPIVIECSTFVTGAAEVGHHIKTILRYSPQELTKPECVSLRQRALKHGGYYHGKIDSDYGNLTIGAERAAAANYDLEPTNLISIYSALSNELDSKFYSHSREPENRKTNRT